MRQTRANTQINTTEISCRQRVTHVPSVEDLNPIYLSVPQNTHFSKMSFDLAFTTLDVFTTVRYEGNPLAIIRVPASLRPSLSQAQKQKIAKEFNLSEIVFLHEDKNSSGTVEIDIFTAHAEVPFAGHPTIGTAYYLLSSSISSLGWKEKGKRQSPEALLTKSGRIPIEKMVGKVGAFIPHNVHIHSATFPSSLTASPSPIVSIVKGMTFILVRLPSVEVLGTMKGSLWERTYEVGELLDEGWKEGIICTYFYVVLESDGDDGKGKREKLELRTRMFGSREDPATGSAASALTCWLSLQKGERAGEGIEELFEYVITQGVEMGKKSVIGVEVTRTGDGKGIEKVLLTGSAVEVMKGNLTVG